MSKTRLKKGFTIVELLVVVSIIALLIGILLPAIGKARDKARTSTSISNLRQLGIAHNAYAGDWEDSQLSLARYNISAYGGTNQSAMTAYNIAIGNPNNSKALGHPPLIAGWGISPTTGNSGLYAYWPGDSGHYWAVDPITFPGGGPFEGFGWFRIPNVKQLSHYVSGRWYDKVFYAPKDPHWESIEVCLDSPSEFPASPPVCNSASKWSTYCLSPAALFSPAVMRAENPGDPQDHNAGWQDPWSVPAGHRTPKMGSIRYPTLKTHMLEHPWLQNVRTICNPVFDAPIGGSSCEPYWFNHGFESAPATLFYDGSARLMGTQEAMNANRRVFGNTEVGLWSTDTPFGGGYAPNSPGGYYSSFAYDFTSTSYHILTTDGALGRDTLGSEQ